MRCILKELDLSGSGCVLVVNCCGNSNKRSGCIKQGNVELKKGNLISLGSVRCLKLVMLICCVHLPEYGLLLNVVTYLRSARKIILAKNIFVYY